MNQAWFPIHTAPKDGTEVLVAVEVAGVMVVRNAFFVDAGTATIRTMNEEEPEVAAEEEVGWWAYKSSVTQEKLEGILAPTHWAPMPGEKAENPVTEKMRMAWVRGRSVEVFDPKIKQWLTGDLGIPLSPPQRFENLRASHLIQDLQNLLEVHGDLKVGIYNPEFCSFNACDNLILKEAEHSDFGDDDQLQGLFIGIQ